MARRSLSRSRRKTSPGSWNSGESGPTIHFSVPALNAAGMFVPMHRSGPLPRGQSAPTAAKGGPGRIGSAEFTLSETISGHCESQRTSNRRSPTSRCRRSISPRKAAPATLRPPSEISNPSASRQIRSFSLSVAASVRRPTTPPVLAGSTVRFRSLRSGYQLRRAGLPAQANPAGTCRPAPRCVRTGPG